MLTLVSAALTLTACGEPGSASRSIGIATDETGNHLLLVEACPADDTEGLVLGPGDDWWGTATARLSADPDVSGPWALNLSDNTMPDSLTFEEDSDEHLDELGLPFFVRVRYGDGLSTAAFDQWPARGNAIAVDLGATDPNAMVETSIDGFRASRLEECRRFAG
ncbi:hypothetical protein [Cellulomonas sp. URHD0024]|uniref:hypothetical protein n=1 Tax=Cellulomonas sp. URHD0024 TaxID=1302620 RepID=UPI0012DEF8CE|nr:hypothetical protein [Cellulomonas sp. URHD0024]